MEPKELFMRTEQKGHILLTPAGAGAKLWAGDGMGSAAVSSLASKIPKKYEIPKKYVVNGIPAYGYSLLPAIIRKDKSTHWLVNVQCAVLAVASALLLPAIPSMLHTLAKFSKMYKTGTMFEGLDYEWDDTNQVKTAFTPSAAFGGLAQIGSTISWIPTPNESLSVFLSSFSDNFFKLLRITMDLSPECAKFVLYLALVPFCALIFLELVGHKVHVLRIMVARVLQKFPTSGVHNKAMYDDLYMEPAVASSTGIVNHPGNVYSTAMYLVAALLVLFPVLNPSAIVQSWYMKRADILYGVLLGVVFVSSFTWHTLKLSQAYMYFKWSSISAAVYLQLRFINLGMLVIAQRFPFLTNFFVHDNKFMLLSFMLLFGNLTIPIMNHVKTDMVPVEEVAVSFDQELNNEEEQDMLLYSDSTRFALVRSLNEDKDDVDDPLGNERLEDFYCPTRESNDPKTRIQLMYIILVINFPAAYMMIPFGLQIYVFRDIGSWFLAMLTCSAFATGWMAYQFERSYLDSFLPATFLGYLSRKNNIYFSHPKFVFIHRVVSSILAVGKATLANPTFIWQVCSGTMAVSLFALIRSLDELAS
eukprot:scaffold5646_cov53-Attheya_sp.AAC.3